MEIRKSVTVARSQEAAFKQFLAIGEWWPRTHSYGGARAKDVFLEGRVGGRFFERFSDGEEFQVGEVVTYDPPRRVVFVWKDPDWDHPTEVEVTFHQDGDRTRVDLVHRGWEHIGTRARHGRTDFDRGWDPVMAAYAAA
ncbi:MAG TPA: SRPBCC domain-containing protein [bacterium]|nr:SRPBCC domain-containing protein [bacterium]